MGGLGNQLFQIFAALAYELEHPDKYRCQFNKKVHGIRQKTYWNTFLQSLEGLCTTDPIAVQYQYNDPSYSYNKLPQFPVSTLLYGYFQSFRYFQKYRDVLFQRIRIREQQETVRTREDTIRTKEDTIRRKEEAAIVKRRICMHFRLGDYKGLPQHHPILPLTYYRAALKHIVQEKGASYEVRFFCETEDIAFVMEQRIAPLQTQFPGVSFVRGSQDGVDDWQEMLAMSLCDDFIIANSTFSWWGAYFGQQTGSRVLYPSLWFGPQVKVDHVRDLFPDGWKRIEAF